MTKTRAKQKGELLFSVTKKDFRIDTFRAGGPGGQNQNKRDTGVRFTHLASGAVGESREFRTQEANKRSAFLKVTAAPKFTAWMRVETARRLGTLVDAERAADRAMAPKNLRIETVDDGGKWVVNEKELL